MYCCIAHAPKLPFFHSSYFCRVFICTPIAFTTFLCPHHSLPPVLNTVQLHILNIIAYFLVAFIHILEEIKVANKKVNSSFLSSKCPLLCSLVNNKHHLPSYQRHGTKSHSTFCLITYTFPCFLKILIGSTPSPSPTVLHHCLSSVFILSFLLT